VVVSALALYGLLLAGTLYGERYPGDAALYVGKYSDLLCIPALAWAFRDSRTRIHGLIAFAASIGIVLLLSYLIHAGVMPRNLIPKGTDIDSAVVFKFKVTHSILMAYAAFLFACLGLDAVNRQIRVRWFTLALLAAANVLFMVQGATGYVILAALALWLAFESAQWRGFAVAAAVTGVAFVALTALPGSFHTRVEAAWSELQTPHAATPDHPSSVGSRLEFYSNSLGLVIDRPVLGYGTGSFPKLYAERVQGMEMTPSRNPHNEFLLLTLQLGVVGLGALAWLLCQQWRLATRLPNALDTRLARGLVITMVVGCLFNSMLLDHTEGLLYAWLTALLFAGLKSSGPRIASGQQ
jgi:O-antigen ligase